MSRKKVILIAAALLIVLIAAGVGYKTLTAKLKQTAPQESAVSDSIMPVNEESASGSDSIISDDETVADAEPETDTDADTAEEELPIAPDFTVYKSDGTEVHLSDFAGKPVIINFWASWCPPCKAELPDFQTLYKEYGDQIEFLMVNLTDGSQETTTTVSAFLLQTGYTFPVYLDTEGSAAYAYEIYSIPVTVGVDENGRQKAQRIGSMSEAEIHEIIDLLLN